MSAKSSKSLSTPATPSRPVKGKSKGKSNTAAAGGGGLDWNPTAASLSASLPTTSTSSSASGGVWTNRTSRVRRGVFGSKGGATESFRMTKKSTTASAATALSSSLMDATEERSDDVNVKSSLLEEDDETSLGFLSENAVNHHGQHHLRGNNNNNNHQRSTSSSTIITSTNRSRMFQRSNSISVLPPKPIRQNRRFSLSASARESSTASSTISNIAVDEQEDFSFGEEWGDLVASAAEQQQRGVRNNNYNRVRSLTESSTSSSSFSGIHGSSSTLSASSCSFLMDDNSNSHGGCGDDSTRERKKIRARRNPIQGTVAPLSTSTYSNTTSFSHLAKSAQDWKRSIESTDTSSRISSPGVTTTTASAVAGSCSEFGYTNDPPSPARSVASSRKRGVGGSPLFSDHEDLSSSNSCTPGALSASGCSSPRPSRSRSRIFSPGSLLVAAPVVPFSFTSTATNEDERGVMDIDSSDDDGDDDDREENSHDDGSSRNASFENGTSCGPSWKNHVGVDHNSSPHSLLLQQHRLVENAQDVLDTMPSYQDVKHAIGELRKQRALHQQNLLAKFVFGSANFQSWEISAKPSWTASRRAAFFAWTTLHLGFTIRAAGGAVHFLQIPREKGADVLIKLEAALVLYKQQQQNDLAIAPPAAAGAEQSFCLMDTTTTSLSSSRKAPSLTFGNSMFLPSPVANNLNSRKTCETTEDLTSKMSALSVHNNKESSPLVRLVTLEHHHHPTTTATSSSTTRIIGRPSLDDHTSIVSSTDMMLHLEGHCTDDDDDDEDQKMPPRMSLASIHSSSTTTGGGNQNRLSVPSYALAAAPSFDIIETPMPKQEERWGSCPVKGRDWGTSCWCPNSSLQLLFNFFEQTSHEAGARDSFEGGVPLVPNSIEPSCSNLHFELEAHGRVVDDAEMMMDESPSSLGMSEAELRRRKQHFNKKRRQSVFMSASLPREKSMLQPSTLFRARRSCLLAVSEGTSTHSGLGETEFPSEELEQETTLHNELPGGMIDKVFSFLTEQDLLHSASLACSTWAERAATAHANLMLVCMSSVEEADEEESGDNDENDEASTSRDTVTLARNSVAISMERSWEWLNTTFPRGKFLAEGGCKQVYLLENAVGQTEAVSVMDLHYCDRNVLAAELSVSILLSSLTRRGICPNFVLIRGIFNCPYEPPPCRWGYRDLKNPVLPDDLSSLELPEEPEEASPGRYHYVRMELCNLGDAEEYTKTLPNCEMNLRMVQSILFQCAFALHAAADRYSVMHYDIKLLNIFLQKQVAAGGVVMRYGLGSHVFAIQMPANEALVAKVADLGTAKVKPESNGQPVTIAQFTTLENTPPDFMILGDAATQGHGHDCFGLGLCMLHLFTGYAPYEEILVDVSCPTNLKKRLRKIWENESVSDYQTIRSIILSDVFTDEAGNITEGEPDETLYHTLYRFLVLFGVPKEKFGRKKHPLVWAAIEECLEGKLSTKSKRNNKRTKGLDAAQYRKDQRKYSLQAGTDRHIARARRRLKSMAGGMDLLLRLCSFNPSERASAMDVLNSQFMLNLQETPGQAYGPNVTVRTYNAFATHR